MLMMARASRDQTIFVRQRRTMGGWSHCSRLGKVTVEGTVEGGSHHKVQHAGTQALKLIGKVIRNPEIQAIVSVLLRALQDPSKKTGFCLQTLLDTKFVHFYLKNNDCFWVVFQVEMKKKYYVTKYYFLFKPS